MISEAIQHVQSGQSLSDSQMTEVVDTFMRGESNDEEIEGLLTALYKKGETVDEVVGAARALRKHMQPIQTNRKDVIDTCGTGGGKTGTFNISTAAALVAAAAGAAVAKHGNRKSTSKTGSADVLQELGVSIECPVEIVQKSINELGICFCFAPLFHPSVRHVMSVRRRLTFPTIFNLLGPLCNPANSPFQLLGAGRGETRQLLAAALAKLGTQRSFVVHGRDGLGEVSHSGPTDISVVEGEQLVEKTFSPSDFGLEPSSLEAIRVEDPVESANTIRSVLSGKPGPARDVVMLNAASAVLVCGLENDPVAAASRAAEAIDSGRAKQVLEDLVAITNSSGSNGN